MNAITPNTHAGTRWYAIYTAARAERGASEAVKDLGFPVFIPMEKRVRVHHGRRQNYEAALFPRYGFVQFDVADQSWGRITDLDEVVDVCRIGDTPRAVPDSLIETLRLSESMGIFDRTKPPRVGMPVEVMEGPFAGWLGKIVRARSGDRVDVLIDLLGRKVDTDMALAWLREV